MKKGTQLISVRFTEDIILTIQKREKKWTNIVIHNIFNKKLRMKINIYYKIITHNSKMADSGEY